MRDYSLDNDIPIKKEATNLDIPDIDFDDEDWEPKEVVAIDNLRLDPDAAKRYREIRKAHERMNMGFRTEGD